MNRTFILFISMMMSLHRVSASENCSLSNGDSTDYQVIQNTQAEIDRVLCAQTPSGQNADQYNYTQNIRRQAQGSANLISQFNPDLHQAATIFDSQTHMIYESPKNLFGPKNLEELRDYDKNNKSVLELMSKPLDENFLSSDKVLSIEQFEQIRQEMFRLSNPSRFTRPDKMTEEEKKRILLENACYLRATMAAEYLARNYPELPVMKTWLLTDKAFEFEDYSWLYHVSPFVPVRIGKDIKWLALDTITLGQKAMDVEEWVDFVIFKDKDDKRRQAPIKVEVTYSERVIPSRCILNLDNIHEKVEDWEALYNASLNQQQHLLRVIPASEVKNQSKNKKKGFFQPFKKKK
jgi:hypothetical protein